MSESPATAERALENARTGYQAAVNLFVNEANRLWARFQAMLIVSTVFVTISATQLANQQPDLVVHILTLLIPIVGIVVSLLWFALQRRGDDYMEYWLRSARELELHYLNDGVRTLDRGYAFGTGSEVRFDLPAGQERHQVGFLGRLTMRRVSNAVIAFFLLVFVVFEALALGRLRGIA